MNRRASLAALGLAVLAGCAGAPQPSASAGPPDAGAALPPPSSDAAIAEDAAPPVDTDAAPAPLDAGADADAPPDIAAIPCVDTSSDVYLTPAGLPPMTPGRRGDVVRCAGEPALDVAALDATFRDVGAVGVQARTGVAVFRIAFRTMRSNGAPGVSTAIVYLPHVPRSRPVPMVVAAHPTEGIADACATSKTQASLRALALPWASNGYAVIAPDYAGLGNGGVQGYLDNRDGAYSLLDATRALQKLVAAGLLADAYLAVGYSQGGGVVLSAQALERTYGGAGKLAGVVSFAPEWQTRLNSFGYVDMMRSPTDLTITTGISKCVVVAMRSYAYFANFQGLGHAGDAFPAAKRSGITGAMGSLCFVPLGGYLQSQAPLLGQLFDDAFRTSFLQCVDGGSCGAPGKDFHDFLAGNVLTADPAGAKVLYVQGLLDTIMRPDEEAACNVAKLAADGVVAQVCTDSGSDHGDSVKRNVAFAMRWGDAVLRGATPEACAAALPACNP